MNGLDQHRAWPFCSFGPLSAARLGELVGPCACEQTRLLTHRGAAIAI